MIPYDTMDDLNLTYEQQYEIPCEITFADAPITAEYAGCGSHEIKMSGKIRLDEARALHAWLSELPGIKQ